MPCCICGRPVAISVVDHLDQRALACLDGVGVRTRDYGFYTKKGLEIWTEPRGTWAVYRWPQYSVHRGRLQ